MPLRVMGTGAFLSESAPFLEAARDARRVYCPKGHWLRPHLARRGIEARTEFPEAPEDGELVLLWGGPEMDDPWLGRALSAGAEVLWGPPIAAHTGQHVGAVSRAAESQAPWPAAQAVLLYGPGEARLPSELLEAGEGTLYLQATRREGPVLELSRERGPEGILLIPALGDRSALSFAAARAVMARLRAPDGCPWDREQTPTSLLPYLLEEAAEAYDAIVGGNAHEMQEELGDLLLQVLFHAQIAEEEGRFTAGDIAVGLRDKLRRRHPHVFGDEHYGSAEEFLPRWEELKREEQHGRESELSGIPESLGSTAAAQKALRRLHRAGIQDASDAGWLSAYESAIHEGRDIDAELRKELIALRQRCERAEAVLGGRLSQFPPSEVNDAWIRADSVR